MEAFQPFLSILITLLIVMDPLGNLPLFLMFTEKYSVRERRRVALTASITACAILVFFGFTGDLVLRLFRIGIPAFQLAGGLILLIAAMQLLRLIPSGFKTSIEEEEEGMTRANVALVPLATPLLAGPGAITTVLVWQQRMASSVNIHLLILMVVLACLVIYMVFFFGERISHLLGVGGIRVLTRLMGLLLSVIAVQFMVDGFRQIQHPS